MEITFEQLKKAKKIKFLLHGRFFVTGKIDGVTHANTDIHKRELIKVVPDNDNCNTTPEWFGQFYITDKKPKYNDEQPVSIVKQIIY